MERQTTPYVCHVFVCVNDRKGERRSCADGLGTALKDQLKTRVEERGWKGRVRVSQSGCLGLCARGPNVMLYPQRVWFSNVGLTDVDGILVAIGSVLDPV